MKKLVFGKHLNHIYRCNMLFQLRLNVTTSSHHQNTVWRSVLTSALEVKEHWPCEINKLSSFGEVTQRYGTAGSVHFWTLILKKKNFSLCRAHEIYCKSIKPIIIWKKEEMRCLLFLSNLLLNHTVKLSWGKKIAIFCG